MQQADRVLCALRAASGPVPGPGDAVRDADAAWTRAVALREAVRSTRRTSRVVSWAAAAAALLVGAWFALRGGAPATNEHAPAAGPSAPFAQAIAAALAAHPGEVVEAGSADGVVNGRHEAFFEVVILDTQGDVLDVRVDPSGKVLSSWKNDEAGASETLGSVLRLLPPDHLSLLDLVRRASAHAQTAMTVAAFAPQGPGKAVGVVRFLAAQGQRQLTLDPATGAVLSDRTVTPEEEDDDEDQRAPPSRK